MTTPNKPRRRWLSFSLRSFFLLVLVIAVSLGWAIHKVREQGVAVAALRKMGCTVGLYADPNTSPTILERLRKLLGEHDFRSITLVSGGRSQITDAGLENLQVLTELQLLFLDKTQVTDAGLVHIRGLTQLQYLHVNGTNVTDAGLVNLRGLTQLKTLYLDEAHVTDAGLVHLEGLTQLQNLDLRGTQATAAGVQRLQRALPKCTILSQR